MKKLLILSALFVLTFALTNAVSAQKAKNKTLETKPMQAKLPSASEVFRKYVEAGGRKAAEKIKSRVTKGIVEMPAVGLKGTFEMINKAPNKSLAVMNLAGFGEILDAFDGTEGWTKNPIQGLRTKSGEELEQVKQINNFYYDLNLGKIYPKAEVTGTDKVGTAEVYVVKADDKTTFYFDKQTGRLLRSDRIFVSPEGRVATQTYFEDFREIGGVTQAHTVRQVAQGMEFLLKTTEIKQNVEIDDTRFSKPK